MSSLSPPTLPYPSRAYLARYPAPPSQLQPPSPAPNLVAWWWISQLLSWTAVIVPVVLRPGFVIAVVPSVVMVGVVFPLLLWLRMKPAEEVTGLSARQPQVDAVASRQSQAEMANEAGETTINVIAVDALREALRTRPAKDVLQQLFSSEAHDLLRTVPAASTSFALVSYRQERHDDGTTLDAQALQSVADVSSGLTGLWLDAWCYRSSGTYDHADFCATLAAVTLHCSEVIWLPRARTGAAPSYVFRLWCTFEAAIVAERGLRVRVAGQGVAPSQSALRRFGSRLPALPWLPPPAEIRELCYWNSCIFFMMICLPFPVIFVYLTMDDPRTLANFSPLLGRQAQMAKSGQRVMQTLHRATAAPAGLLQHAPKPVDGKSPVESLQLGLPWLPAYDRRDALAVRHALDALAGREEDAAAMSALAFSVFAAAHLLPSPGDSVSGCGGSLRRWLAEKAIAVPGKGGVSTWLDGTPTPATNAASRLPLWALADLGWTWKRGASFFLRNPTGILSVSQPHRGAWSAHGMQPIHLPWKLDEAGAYWSSLQTLVGGVSALAMLLIWYLSGSSAGLANGLIVYAACFAPAYAFPFLLEYVRNGYSARQTGLPPHYIDNLALLQPGGYKISVMIFGYALGLIGGISTIWLGMSSAVSLYEGWWTAYAFDTSSAPPERQLFCASQLCVGVVWVGTMTAMVTSQFFHLWQPGATPPKNEASKGYLL